MHVKDIKTGLYNRCNLKEANLYSRLLTSVFKMTLGYKKIVSHLQKFYMDQISLQDAGAIDRLVGENEARANLEASKKYMSCSTRGRMVRATCSI